MKYFSVPADFKKETINSYYSLNKAYHNSKVIETYGQITLGTGFESGRANRILPQIDILDLRDYIQYSKERDIEFNYTFNAPYMQNREFTVDGVSQIKHFLYELYESGVRILTIAMPSLMELVKSTGLDFTVKVSTICQITNTNKAMFYKKKGIDRIVLDESLNREFHTLKRIRDAFGENIEIISNSLCHKECTYRMFHYLQTCGTYCNELNIVGGNFITLRCSLKIFEDINNLMRLSWIRPEDLKYYSRIGIQYFKLQGREYVLSGDPVRAVECYFKEEYDGNLMELLDMFSSKFAFKFYVDNKKLDGFLEPYFEKENFCKHDCTSCSYCESFAKKCVDFKKAKDMIKLAEKFYIDIDEYAKFVKSVENDSKEINDKELEFDFDIT